MIIQAGFDLELLAHPLVVQGGKVLPRLVVVSLDAEMQLDGISIVTEDFKGRWSLTGMKFWMDLIPHGSSSSLLPMQDAGLKTTTTTSLPSCKKPKH